jgi:hypothetical protein
MKSTEFINFYLCGAFFNKKNDVDIDVSYMHAQLDFRNSSLIFSNQSS